MKMAKFYQATGALVAGMDKKKAARQAASVASAVANGNGAPHMRVLARVVAHTLTAIGNPQADGAAPVTPGPGSGSGTGPATEPTAGWEQALRAVQKLRQARLSESPTARIEGASVSDPATTTSEQDGGYCPQDHQSILQGPFAAPAQTVLRGPLDTANCGDFSFSLYTAQLLVSMLGTSGGIGGEYHVPSLPLHVWTRLIGRGGDPLPIIVYRDHGELALRVGNVPETRRSAASARTGAAPNPTYKSPEQVESEQRMLRDQIQQAHDTAMQVNRGIQY